MNLHEDNELFSELIEVTAESMGLPQVYVEKDYWITKALKQLAISPYIDSVVLKGGTSLSKAYKLIERFSEDIDLAVFAKDLGDSKRKTLIRNVENIVANGLTYLQNDPRESKGSKYRKTVYQYPRQIAKQNFGQASSELLIEINAFSQPEPFVTLELQSLITEVLTKLKRIDLIQRFELTSFMINVLAIRRTLVEKILSVIKDSYTENPIARLSMHIRHLYDICLIMREQDIQAFLGTDEFKLLCSSCIEVEKVSAFEYAHFLDNPLAAAPLFTEFKHWQTDLEIVYNGIFADLVYGELPSMQEIAEKLKLLHAKL